ncbi:hypothetical protein SCOR_02435 [Sulfidibacter corallicola]|uniref:RHS repeat-associated core domain-containing protein n=1 Tax=Sulfidibacter corallicola TaxID=2818388 RepID=A0A8A4TIK0_SULCO|nr:RHS repeat-associated core domain-containing protein [Sulfidibacter corallicola]QTD48618.1 hypothetical protein J3U87_23810 [Sulfidibacter corallicola]
MKTPMLEFKKMRLSLLTWFSLCVSLSLPVMAQIKSVGLPGKAPVIAPFVEVDASEYAKRLTKSDTIVTDLDKPDFDPNHAFDAAAPNASIDLYSGALVIQETDLFFPGPYGLNLEVNRDYHGKIYAPRTEDQRLLKPDTWIGVGWEMNWGILEVKSDEVLTFRLSGHATQNLFLATDGTGTDPAGQPTHNYTFTSPINGEQVVPYMSPSLWRAWKHAPSDDGDGTDGSDDGGSDSDGDEDDSGDGNGPNGEETDAIWYVQDPSGKIYQIHYVLDNILGRWLTTRIFHPKTQAQITFDYQPTQIRILQDTGTRLNEVFVRITDGALVSVQGGGRTIRYRVEPCFRSQDDPRLCLLEVTDAEGLTTRYSYGTTGLSWPGELTEIHTPLGARYTYHYGEETFYHQLSSTGQFTTRVVKRWERGTQTWTYTYDHPMPLEKDETHAFFPSDQAYLTTTVEGPENVRRDHVFYTYAGMIANDTTYTIIPAAIGHEVLSVTYHHEHLDGEGQWGGQVASHGLTNQDGAFELLYFTHYKDPVIGEGPSIPLPSIQSKMAMRGQRLDFNTGGYRNMQVFSTRQTTYGTGPTTGDPGVSKFTWIRTPFPNPERVTTLTWDSYAEDDQHQVEETLTYLRTGEQLMHNQVGLVAQRVIRHNRADADTGLDGKRGMANAVTYTYRYNAFGDLTQRTTHDHVTGQSAQTLILRDYGGQTYTAIRPNRDPVTVHMDASLIVRIIVDGTTLRSATYDPFGNMRTFTNSLDQTTELFYDDADRIERIVPPMGPTTEHHYTVGVGATVTSRTGSGPAETLTFDPYGRKTGHTHDLIPDAQFQYGYDALDRLASVTHPRGGVTTWTYDELGRTRTMTRHRDGVAEVLTREYHDFHGTRTVDPKGNATTLWYNGQGAPYRHIDALGIPSDYQHDALGRLIQIDRGRITRNLSYSGTGLLLSESHPENGYRKFHYNDAGDLITTRFFGDVPNGQNDPFRVVGLTYDGRGRTIEERVMPSGPSINYTFDSENLTHIENEHSRFHFEYDGANRLSARHVLWKDANQELTTRFDYDEGTGLVSSIEYPSGTRVAYHIEEGAVRGVEVSGNGGANELVSRIDYTAGMGSSPNPMVKSFGLGNGLNETRLLDDYARHAGAEVTGQAGTLFRRELAFDPNGMVTGRATWLDGDTQREPDVAASYRYDPLGRVTYADYRRAEWTDPGHSKFQFEDFYYDIHGNLLARGGNIERAPLRYLSTPDRNGDGDMNVRDLWGIQLGEVDGGEASASDDLDGDGVVDIGDLARQALNLAPFVKKQDANPTRLPGWEYNDDGSVTTTPDGESYSYNDWNQLVGYGDGRRLNYDAEGRRLAEWSEGEPTRKLTLFNAGGKPIAEYEHDAENLVLLREMYHFEGAPIAADIYSRDSEACPERVYYHRDYLGSPVHYSDENGDLVGGQGFTAFGSTWNKDLDCVPVQDGFTGHQSLSGAELTWMQARTYNPKYGRFLQTDPVTVTSERLFDPEQLNLYGYVRNSPVSAVDPTGEIAWAVAGALIGGGADLTWQLIQNGGDFGKVDYMSVAVSAGTGAFGGAGLKVAAKVGGSVVKTFGKQFGKEFLDNAIPIPSTKELREAGLPKIVGSQKGLRDPGYVDVLKADMKNGDFDYKSLDGRIGINTDHSGTVQINGGHHRMTAALEHMKETGDSKPVKELLDNARPTEVPKLTSQESLGRTKNQASSANPEKK